MKKLFSLLLCLSLLTLPALALKGEVYDPNELPYVMGDSLPSSWAKSEIDLAVDAGLVPELTGFPRYQDNITREQFAELSVNMVKMVIGDKADMSKAKTFSDCTNQNVLEASAFGIVDGVGGGKFAPKQTTTREQIATMLARAITVLEADGTDITPAGADLAKFTDKAQVSTWAADSVGLLAANAIMKGTSDTTLSPKAPCTVEQSILLVYRIYKQFPEMT